MLFDPDTRVSDVHHKTRVCTVVARLNLNFSPMGEFICILYKIDQNLLDSAFVTQKDWRQIGYILFDLGNQERSLLIAFQN